MAKAVYGLDITRQLMSRLRGDRQLLQLFGWNTIRSLPDEATFSRAFAEFAQSELPQRLHAALIECTQKDRIISHIARDSTAIEAARSFPTSGPPPNRSASSAGPSAPKPPNAAHA